MMPHDAHLDSEYLRRLVAGLGEEVATVSDWTRVAPEVIRGVQDLEALVCHAGEPDAEDAWNRAWSEYRSLRSTFAAYLNEVASVARCYPSMEAFWADADAQSAGASPFTFWDVYEHGGRRRLEAALAAAYGADAALLLNSGMSAIAVAIGAFGLSTGATIVTGTQNYFETTEYLDLHVARLGVSIVRVAVSDAEAVRRVLQDRRPALMLFETVTNSPDIERPEDVLSWLSVSPDTMFVCDNTVQGLLTPWFRSGLAGLSVSDRFVVVESATKYLCHDAMAGIVYGNRHCIEAARLYARATGQNLQEKAFNYLRSGEIASLPLRMKLHARNVRLLVEGLSPVVGRLAFLRTLTGPDGRTALPPFTEGSGCLVFLALSDTNDDRESDVRRHRELLARWQHHAARMECDLKIRAGFGWDETSARIYEGARLNQSDAPTYLRLSVGIEPPSRFIRLVDALGAAIGDVT